MEHPSKKPALESAVLNGSGEEKPFNHVNDEMTNTLQAVPRGVRKSVTEGYRIPPTAPPAPPPRPNDTNIPQFRSHAEDIIEALNLISPEAYRSRELKPLYQTHAYEAEPRPTFPDFPGPSGERKRRMHRETSPSSSAGNSPESSPPPVTATLDAQGDVDMDGVSPLPPPPAPPQASSSAREIKPRPKRTMARNVQSLPVGTFMFRGGTYASPAVQGQDGDMMEEDKRYEEVDFSSFAKRPPE